MGFFHWNIYLLRFEIAIDLFLKFPVKRYLAINRYIGGTIVQPTVKMTSSFIEWPENVRRVNKILWSFLKHCYMLLNFVLFFRSSWQSVTISNTHVTTEHENKSTFVLFWLVCSISLVNIIPTEFFIHLLIIIVIFMEFMYCVNTPSHSQILHLFFSLQVKCQIITCINSFKITYIPIIWLLTVWERFIFQKTEKKITVQRLLYQGVN